MMIAAAMIPPITPQLTPTGVGVGAGVVGAGVVGAGVVGAGVVGGGVVGAALIVSVPDNPSTLIVQGPTVVRVSEKVTSALVLPASVTLLVSMVMLFILRTTLYVPERSPLLVTVTLMVDG